MNTSQILGSIAGELANLINAKNDAIKSTIHCQMETPPDLHDMESCQQLQVISAHILELEEKVVALTRISETAVANALAYIESYGFDAEDADGEKECMRELEKQLKEIKVSESSEPVAANPRILMTTSVVADVVKFLNLPEYLRNEQLIRWGLQGKQPLGIFMKEYAEQMK